jgi:hypothetical protein
VLAYGSLGLLQISVALFIIVSPWVYRRILREDTGLAVPKKIVPLEESSLSLTRLEKTYKQFSRYCLVMLIWYFANFLFAVTLWSSGVIREGFEWSIAYFLGDKGIWFGFMVVGIVFYVTFRQFHKRLMATAEDETTFQTIGPVWERQKMPFAERVFVEWLVYFGCFVAAVLIAITSLQSGIVFIFCYNYPIPFLLKLVLVLAGSMVLAAINAGFPRLRWLVILGGCLLIGYGINSIYMTMDFGAMNMRLGKVVPLDSPRDWPYLFAIIWLNIYVTISVFATLILGGLHYYAKWNGKTMRFSLPKKIVIAYCIVGTLLLCFAPGWYSSFRVPYWYNRSVFTKADNAQKIEMCNEILRLSPEGSSFHIRALGRRGDIYAKMKQYDPALADFDAGIQLYEKQPERNQHEFRIWHGVRGNMKFALGDLHGAIADYTVSLDDPQRQDRNATYHRGDAYEKLGETEKAIADYTVAIEILEKANYREKYVEPVVPRPESVNPSRVSLEELKEIRDRLKQVTHQ